MREDWIECTLDEVGEIYSGGTPKTSISEYWGEEISWISPADLSKYTEKYIARGRKSITSLGLKKSSAKLIPSGSILFSCRAPIGYVVIAENGLTTNQGFKSIFPNSGIFNDYVYYYLKASKNRAEKKASGTTFKEISKKSFSELYFPLPPLPIQRAIVAKIEELFSSLDSGIADLKKAQDQLKIYRQAVLSSSFPKKETIEISELVENLSQGWSPKCINQSSNDDSQWAVIKTSAIQSGRFVEFENKILPDTLEPRKQHEIKKGDILITRAGPRVRVGICCLVRETRPKLINCDKVYRLKLNNKIVDAEYFQHALNSPEILRKIEKMKSGSSDSGLNLTQKVFLKLQIPFIRKAEQHQIVCEIESRLSVCDKVEESIAVSLEKAKALRQSILKKAFEGKLLSAAEIAKCKAEKDYEPASVLLARIERSRNEKIKEEKASKQVKSKTRTVKKATING